MQIAITSTAEGKQAAAELQSKFAPRQTDSDNMRKQLDDLQTRLRTGQTTLSDDEKARLAREGDVLDAHLSAQAAGSAGRFQRRAAGRGEPHRPEDDGILDKYSKDNGYAVIFDTSAQQTPVVFAANQIDVTQDIIRLYDQANPGEGRSALRSAPPAAPSTAPKPCNCAQAVIGQFS